MLFFSKRKKIYQVFTALTNDLSSYFGELHTYKAWGIWSAILHSPKQCTSSCLISAIKCSTSQEYCVSDRFNSAKVRECLNLYVCETILDRGDSSDRDFKYAAHQMSWWSLIMKPAKMKSVTLPLILQLIRKGVQCFKN